MYERFTDRARKVVQLAVRQATCRFSPAVQTEHILLGLLEEGSGVAANVLCRLNADWEKFATAVAAGCKSYPPPSPSEVRAKPRLTVWRAVVLGIRRLFGHPDGNRRTLSAESKRLIEDAMQEARSLGHNYVGTEHLLLGMLHQPGSCAARFLVEQGLTLERVRREVLDLLGTA